MTPSRSERLKMCVEDEPGDETFTITLSDPNGAELAQGALVSTLRRERSSTTTTPLRRSSCGQDGETNTVWLVYDEPLDEGSVPAASAYVVRFGSDTIAVEASGGVLVEGRVVTLTLESAGTGYLARRVSYTAPASDAIQDRWGNPAAGFADEEVQWHGVTTRTVSVAPVSAEEGEALVFTVTLSASDTNPTSVDWRAVIESVDTATTDDIAGARSGTVRIEPGETTATFAVHTVEDEDSEGDETFTVRLANPVNAILDADASEATGTIENDDVDEALRPLALSAAIDGVNLVLTYDRALDETSVPAADAYTVSVDGSEVPLAATDPVSVSGTRVILKTAAVVDPGATVTLVYTVPDESPIQETGGTDARPLPSQSVTNNTAPWPASEFITKWETTTANEVVKITRGGASPSYIVDWGDGSSATTYAGNASHTYAVAGIYTVRISGGFNRIRTRDDATNARKLVSIEQWGTAQWTSMEGAFAEARNMTYAATDAPDLSNVTNLSFMFYRAYAFNGDISGWQTGSVTTLESTFEDARAFNQPIGEWDTAAVTTLKGTFRNAGAFNQPIGDWDTAEVTTLEATFSRASVFNQPIGAWDTGNVTSMRGMLELAGAFNQPIDGWDVSSVTDMTDMFNQALSFVQTLAGWYVSLDDDEASEDDRTVGTITAQNAILRGHSPVYALASSSQTNFEIGTGNVLQVKADAELEAGDYTVRIEVSGSIIGFPGHTDVVVRYVEEDAAPVLQSATIDGVDLVLTYDNALDTDSTPAASAYTVSVDGSTAPLAAYEPGHRERLDRDREERPQRWIRGQR